jgi:hypothetical protein
MKLFQLMPRTSFTDHPKYLQALPMILCKRQSTTHEFLSTKIVSNAIEVFIKWKKNTNDKSAFKTIKARII